jgi:hypothetical protein
MNLFDLENDHFCFDVESVNAFGLIVSFILLLFEANYLNLIFNKG